MLPVVEVAFDGGEMEPVGFLSLRRNLDLKKKKKERCFILANVMQLVWEYVYIL